MSTWRRFRRVGRARIVREVHEPETWTSPNGDKLTALPGFILRGEDGNEWPVERGAFDATYRRVGDMAYRTGHVIARPARVGERVETLEGWAAAGPGDILVEDGAMNHWFVPRAQFEQSYALAE